MVYIPPAKVLLFFEICKWICFLLQTFRLLWIMPKVLQVLFGLGDHFAITVAHLLPKCALSVSFSFKYFCLYNNAAKIFGVEGVLRRRFAVLEREMVYTTRGSICITRVSVWVYFFWKSFRLPKVTPKVVPKIISALALKIIIFIRIKARHAIVVVLVRFDRVFMFAVSQCATNHLY